MHRLCILNVFLFFALPCLSLSIGDQAPELDSLIWQGETGQKIEPLFLKKLQGKVIVLNFFQNTCPACHRYGIPVTKQIDDFYQKDERVEVLGILTALDHYDEANSVKQLKKIREKYALKYPLAHDDGDWTGSKTWRKYKAKGTPWTVIISKKGKILLSQFVITLEEAKKIIQSQL